jgi:fucose permease
MRLTYRHTKYASYLGYITQAIVNNLAPLLFYTFKDAIGIPLEKIGLLVAVNFFVQMVVDIACVRYIDRIGYRAGAVAAHVFATMGLICLGVLPTLMADKYTALLIAVTIYAVGGGLTEVLISPIIESLPGDEKASAMSLLHSFYCWGHVAVVILSSVYFLAFGVENWRFLPILWALVPLFNAFFFSRVPLRVLVEESERVPVKRLFSSGIFWLFLALMICAGASEQAMSQWTSLFAQSGLNVDKTVGDLLGPGMFAAMMGLSRLLYGIFGSRLNIRRGLELSAALCIASYVIAVLSPWALLSLAGCALCGFSVGLMWPGTFSLAARDYAAGGTAMFALLAFAGDVGCAAGPGVVGVVSGWFEALRGESDALKIGIGAAIGFPILMLLGVLLLGKAEKK